jgi:hypothetical protein
MDLQISEVGAVDKIVGSIRAGASEHGGLFLVGIELLFGSCREP